MNSADWAIVIILTLSSVISLVRGFAKEALSLVFLVIAVVAANLFSENLEPHLKPFIETPSLRALAALILVFVGVLLLGALLNFGLGLLIKASGLSGTDRLLGMLFGFLRGLFIVMTLMIYLPVYLPVKADDWYQTSKIIPYLEPYVVPVKNATGEVTRWMLNLMSASRKQQQDA